MILNKMVLKKDLNLTISLIFFSYDLSLLRINYSFTKSFKESNRKLYFCHIIISFKVEFEVKIRKLNTWKNTVLKLDIESSCPKDLLIIISAWAILSNKSGIFLDCLSTVLLFFKLVNKVSKISDGLF